ncbi:adenosine deaminase [Hymenobacter edaphi]|uniref:adenosine deaminase n=1 Tax=Hymenobacter edaphi TaxID=2211146 RepID=A0A328BSB9_9BACT|nr:adenosine deaminase [Hymenobacter edaphi]RAK70172.1 adenosine deaminase [Hymenobacter edaphi]
MESLNSILAELRGNRSALFSFFSMMPKGGDLHHHYSGSIYAESYIAYVIEKNYYINTETLEVVKELPTPVAATLPEWQRFSKLENLEQVKLRMLRKWSDKDFTKGVESNDEHFFATFPSFSVASKENYVEGLIELKKRALNQRISYIETIFISLDLKTITVPNEAQYDQVMLYCQRLENKALLTSVLDELVERHEFDIQKVADKHNEMVKQLHTVSKMDDASFIMRYQNYAARFRQPTDMFIELLACFYSAAQSPLIVGVNIVAAENGEVAMRDYWLHMQFYAYLEAKYKGVQYAIHAGELTTGMVQPEKLGRHIRDAITIAKPTRIGHAVDIIYDNEFTSTIELLKEKDVVIEINLSSNEFILGVANDMHPVELYYKNGIPIVICTDDEGVLRSSITEQYVILAHRYKFTYDQIKELVINSIRRSFIKEDTIKDQLEDSVKKGFVDFEQKIINHYMALVFEAPANPQLTAAFTEKAVNGNGANRPKLKLTNFAL